MNKGSESTRRYRNEDDARPHVVIIGAGFGGVWAAKALASQPVRVTLYDRNNYHTFLPLLYQVAAAEIEPEQIAYPVRGILRRMANVDFALADVTAVDLEAKTVIVNGRVVSFDYLILATGSVTRFFGIPGAQTHAFSLKTMEEAVLLRNHILACFERAVHIRDEARRRRLLTFVVVGGGPTGVEYAGALSELVYGPLRKDFPELDVAEVSILLLEAVPQLLSAMPPPLGAYATRELGQMGVAVRLEAKVTAVSGSQVKLDDGSVIETQTVVWVAGVGGEELAEDSGIEVLGNGRVPVLPTLQLPRHPAVYAVGDLAAFEAEGQLLPMVAQVAMQQGEWAARNIGRQLAGAPLQPFRYKDKGTMATIGRNKAVVSLGRYRFKGFFAWVIWLFVHIFYLIGFRNRIMVIVSWAWRYLTFEQMVRLILPANLIRQPLDDTAPAPADNTPAAEKEDAG